MTKNGIEYNLPRSPYKAVIKDITLYFSSKNYKEKFLETIESYQTEVSYSLEKRYGVLIDCEVLALVTLYNKIEKRGFYFTDKEGTDYNCLEEIRLVGNRLIKR